VRGKGVDAAQAIRLVNVAVEEARALYMQLNTVNSAEIAAALATRRERAREELARAHKRFDRFVAATRSADLPLRIQSQAQTISELRGHITDAEADLAAAQATGDAGLEALVSLRLNSFKDQLKRAEANLERLNQLQPRFAELGDRVAEARRQLTQLEQTESSLTLAQLFPLPEQVKVLDSARIQSDFFTLFLVYGLGIVLGLLAAITAVYLFALFDRQPETAESVVAGFGAPLLASIPPDEVR
jgi:uncharacterized protein involved in exopolysaccharide biosynthesis